MSYIYKITNQINGKSYIGKTNLTIEERFKEHKHDALSRNKEQRPLYRAFKKYGVENFSIEEVEECSPKEASEREQYWIQYYGTYHNGYNATLGGDGRSFLDYDGIIKAFDSGALLTEIASNFHCSIDSVRIILNNNNRKIPSVKEINQARYGIPVCQLDLYGNLIDIYPSMREAARITGISSIDIGRCCKGKSKTSGGYKWIYENPEEAIQKIKAVKTSLNPMERCELKEKIRTESFSQISREYSVSSTTVIEWAKKANLPYRKKDINSYSDEEWELI